MEQFIPQSSLQSAKPHIDFILLFVYLWFAENMKFYRFYAKTKKQSETH